MTELQLHPLCTLFPRIDGAAFDALVSDIAQNGLREAITTHDGMILDGGNRYRACLQAGVTPRLVKFSGDNIVSFVLSCNLHRRHMSPGQQAAIVASAQDWSRANGRGGDRKSDQSATLHFDSVEKRAAESGASIRTQKMADTVARRAPELARQVAHGEISLPQAVRQVAAPAAPRGAPPAPKAPEPALSTPAGALQAENARLCQQLQEAQENARELADSLQASMTLDEGQESTAAELRRLYALVTTLESQRDQYMIKCNQLIKTVDSLKRQLARAEKAHT